MFIDVITKLCARSNISAYKLCENIGLNRSAVAKWKRGATPNGTTLNKIAEYFGVSVDYLLGKEDSKSRIKVETFDDFTYAMHNEAGKLSDRDKEILLKLAKEMAERSNENDSMQ